MEFHLEVQLSIEEVGIFLEDILKQGIEAKLSRLRISSFRALNERPAIGEPSSNM